MRVGWVVRGVERTWANCLSDISLTVIQWYEWLMEMATVSERLKQ